MNYGPVLKVYFFWIAISCSGILQKKKRKQNKLIYGKWILGQQKLEVQETSGICGGVYKVSFHTSFKCLTFRMQLVLETALGHIQRLTHPHVQT